MVRDRVLLFPVLIFLVQLPGSWNRNVNNRGPFSEMRTETDNLKIYACNRIDREINLTGRINDPLWTMADAIQLVDVVSGKSPKQKTEVRLLYSETRLYIAFRCEDDYIWGTHEQRDSPVYQEECVEVFVSPSGSDHQYFEINVSPKNTVFDACILSNRIHQRETADFMGLIDFNPDIITRVFIEGEFGKPGKGKFWSVEYAIPFSELFGAPNPVPISGDQWRINLYRIDAPEGTRKRYYAWSPTGKVDFHRPWRFGILRFN